MSEQMGGLESASNAIGKASDTISELFAVTRPETVYAAPQTYGDVTIINCSEYVVGAGMGFGMGEGSSPEQQNSGAGGGGGGGGYGMARPVATIVIEPGGVRLEPVFDLTKVALAGITAFGAMFIAMNQMRREARKLRG